jgi:hypothetical protein
MNTIERVGVFGLQLGNCGFNLFLSTFVIRNVQVNEQQWRWLILADLAFYSPF